METEETTVSSRGRVTSPVDIRQRPDTGAGDRLRRSLGEAGSLRVPIV
ncbi:hypothetical protein NDI56_14805 [Haloarcula sp. S1CR25-12]|uniref:3-deoxy-7-phosphoheptulonate synthase n=1 Tax=Haloarcula saliterrae TaxID=2950534 RepID=A0ABU2FEJ5_9EURY|nr:hypothetical protein [Haloarcula sp. S1CR25-12]MDS0260674.1 hypothetical protein [Haloarcula sp. S1CR25-12]